MQKPRWKTAYFNEKQRLLGEIRKISPETLKKGCDDMKTKAGRKFVKYGIVAPVAIWLLMFLVLPYLNLFLYKLQLLIVL